MEWLPWALIKCRVFRDEGLKATKKVSYILSYYIQIINFIDKFYMNLINYLFYFILWLIYSNSYNGILFLLNNFVKIWVFIIYIILIFILKFKSQLITSRPTSDFWWSKVFCLALNMIYDLFSIVLRLQVVRIGRIMLSNYIIPFRLEILAFLLSTFFLF